MPYSVSRRAILGLVTLATAVSSATIAAAQSGEPVKVGVIIAQSPPGSVVQGTQIKDGLEIARDMVNQQGGVLGRKIELVIEDGQGVPEKGRSAAEKLITNDKVVALTGEHQSSNVLAEIEVAHRYKVPYINTNGWSDVIREKGYPEVFNPSNYNTRVASAMAEVISHMGVKNVLAFAENTDYGIGQAKALAEFLKEKAPNVKFRYETLDRAAKDFTPAVLPLRSSPPDMVINIMLPPAAYIVMNQLYEQGVAPSATTWFYDGAGIADYPDFWANVGEAGKNMLSFGLYHPSMNIPEIGKKVGDEYTKRTKNEPNRLIFQAADSLFLIVDAIKRANSTDPAQMIQALKDTKYTGTRGTIEFSQKPGYTFQQWVEIPYVTYQLTEVKQPLSKAPLVQEPGKPLDTSKLAR
ncbi:ABC transporter substrate-binding protein [Microvirga massiliensis]|uniref:ABC transporter substrate-binding protein n=1 Tax=Microvirga massiliensis TaxID=1033741 RepID=UPI00062BCE46|nr:ABC transporter substrate-binding protein [Microvirga massiliensis]